MQIQRCVSLWFKTASMRISGSWLSITRWWECTDRTGPHTAVQSVYSDVYCASSQCSICTKLHGILFHGSPFVDIYRMHLHICGTKLSRITNLLNIRGFYFCRCWEQIDVVDHLVLGKLCNSLKSNEELSVFVLFNTTVIRVQEALWHPFFTILQHLLEIFAD